MWWFKTVPYHLPKARGPFVPGCMDVSLDYTKSGLFFRLYYPTEAIDDDEQNCKRWQPCHPDHNYTLGLAKVIMVATYLVRFFYWKSGPMCMPILYGEKVRAKEKLKCVIFSHGLGAFRGMYSTICAEMASRGYLVAALEHRDESSCHTYFYKSKSDARNNKQTYIKYKNIGVGKHHYENRSKQIHYRAEECERVLDFFKKLNKGDVPYNVIDDVPTELDIRFKLEDLVGNLDLDSVTVAGHSFGGATALLALSKSKGFKQGIILDPWMFPIKGEDENKVTQPLIFINTQTFHITANVQAMAKYLSSNNKREMYTILHTTHENQADPLFWAGYWLNWFMKKIDPLTGMLINNSLILRFLKENTNHSVNIDDCFSVLNKESVNFTSGLTNAWA